MTKVERQAFEARVDGWRSVRNLSRAEAVTQLAVRALDEEDRLTAMAMATHPRREGAVVARFV